MRGGGGGGVRDDDGHLAGVEVERKSMLRLENRNRPLGGVENQPQRGGRVAKGPVKTSLGKN